jgi:glutamyl-tRNA synthetase
MLPYLHRSVSDSVTAETKSKLAQIAQAAGDRIKVAGDILDYRDFFTPDEALKYDEAAFEKRIRTLPEAKPLLQKFRDRLATAPTFDAPALEKLLHDFLQTEGVLIGQVIHALRVALTGKAVGFGVFETMAILGKEHSLERIDSALAR